MLESCMICGAFVSCMWAYILIHDPFCFCTLHPVGLRSHRAAVVCKRCERCESLVLTVWFTSAETSCGGDVRMALMCTQVS